MLNQIVVVGRLVKNPIEEKNEEGKTLANITLAVPRSYKNANGEYDTDFLEFTLWENTASSTTKYCKKGDIIGIKGRVESINTKDGYKMRLIAEKVTFLSSTSKSKEEAE